MLCHHSQMTKPSPAKFCKINTNTIIDNSRTLHKLFRSQFHRSGHNLHFSFTEITLREREQNSNKPGAANEVICSKSVTVPHWNTYFTQTFNQGNNELSIKCRIPTHICNSHQTKTVDMLLSNAAITSDIFEPFHFYAGKFVTQCS